MLSTASNLLERNRTPRRIRLYAIRYPAQSGEGVGAYTLSVFRLEASMVRERQMCKMAGSRVDLAHCAAGGAEVLHSSFN
jgi:hypothetical protein